MHLLIRFMPFINEPEVEQNLDKAFQALKIADHMIIMTYQTFQDAKLLLAVVKRLERAVFLGLKAVIVHERLWKRIPPTSENFDTMLKIFKEKIIRRYSIQQQDLKVINELRELLHSHQSSPLEFSHKGRFIIATNNYKLRTLNQDAVKRLVLKVKGLIESMAKGINATTPTL